MIHAENVTDASSYSNLSVALSDDSPVIDLNNNYCFDNDTDSKLISGVKITKNLTINGNNNYIDGNNQARGLHVKSHCCVILENLTFKNCFSQSRGGAIYLASNSSLTLKNCFFINNKVYNSNGGAICAQSSTNIDISNTSFLENSAIRESNLEWSQFKRGMGSALCVGINSIVHLYDSIFKSNNAQLSTVLIISYNDAKIQLSKLFVDNCLFEDNTAKTNAAIYLDEFGEAEITNSQFKNNHATDSGGILALDASKNALVRNCLFESNTAVKGGAIYMTPYNGNPTHVTIIDCDFIKNSASENGGAIYANSADLNIINSNFNKNTAPDKGGAIFTYKTNVKIDKCQFSDNKANNGGAGYLISNDATVTNSIFAGNIASNKGGAISSGIIGISASNNRYTANRALKGDDVYGIFNVEVTQTSNYYGCVKLTVKVSSPWKISPAQNIKLKFKGSKTYNTGWLKVPSNGILKLKVPLDLKVGSYSLEVTSDSGACNLKPIKINVVKSKAKIIVQKTTAHYKSGKVMKIKVKNAKSGDYLRGVKLKVKVKQGSSHNTFTATTGSDGVARVDVSKFGIGKYDIKISSADKGVKISKKVKTKVTVKRGTCSVVAPKSVKKHEKVEVKVLSSVSKKPIKKFKVYLKTPKKTLKIKTDSKGSIKINTAKLNKGKNKFMIFLNSKKYHFNKRFTVKIK